MFPKNIKPKLRFRGNRIQEIESRYDYSITEVELLELRPKVQNRGYVSKEKLQKIACWKAQGVLATSGATRQIMSRK